VIWTPPATDVQPPEWAARTVDAWAREQGCAPGTVKWNPVLKCWEINLGLKPDDPRLKLYQEGKLAVKPAEVVFLHVRRQREDGKSHFEGLDIEQLGESGIRELLDRGSVTSGRGEHRNLMEAVQAVAARNEEMEEKRRKHAETFARENARDKRRAVLGIPVLPGADLKGDN
jgi:hypothetical protein